MNKTPFKAGDRVVFNKGEAYYGAIAGLTPGKVYTVLKTTNDNRGDLQLLWVYNDKCTEMSTYASRVTRKVEGPAKLSVGDRVRYRLENGPAYSGSLTHGGEYTVTHAYSEYVGVVGDRGSQIRCYAKRFELVKSAVDIQAERERRKVSEAERKKAGSSRAHSMRLGQITGLVKKPLLFAELSACAVHEAIESAIKAKLSGLSGIKVVGLDKTTEGYKVTLGQYA
ncbi:hypothetical protein [Rhizobium rhizogenes]|uniref:hypothetical protein n=1 Tax=Rhizobium rhizogenes TaxID=359 RepID=UPI001574B375|nr:hypothetical protein [Rhizobium rhizogenes]NTH18432.1 hypothetical protein [Rhizobium rhizogenes]NTH31405.1 hypothetical protein [Rhizobium rhizogenes]